MTIVRSSGSTPQRTGAKMLVFADGRTVGTIGGGCYENDALGRARDAIASGRPAIVKYDLNDDFAQESGLICGGQMEVYIDPIAPAPALYVIGAGHVGWHLARVFDALEAEGMPVECLARVHAPIGLDIGAITPAEIAISILAELIAVRHGKDVSPLSMKWNRPKSRP